MPIQNPQEIKQKIVSFIGVKGPSLPVHVAKETNLSMLFASAFLSELLSEKTIKISNMKVGGSPLYFLPGQEPQLERFSDFLKGKEKEAFSLIKDKKALEDEKQNPPIRVALRALRDFAFPFKFQERIFWRYFIVSENEAIEIIKKEIKLAPKPIPKPPIKIIKETPIMQRPEIQKPIITEIKKIEKRVEREKPLIEKKEEKVLIKIKEKPIKKIKEKSEFVLKLVEYLKKQNIELLEEIEFKKKEFTGKVRINSDVGKIEFLLIAKDKKNMTENDLTLAVQKGNSSKMPVLLISTGDLNKKAMDYFQKYKNLLKFKKF